MSDPALITIEIPTATLIELGGLSITLTPNRPEPEALPPTPAEPGGAE